MHQLEILVVLGGGAAGHFVDPLGDVRFVEPAKAAEGGEELVVLAPTGRGDKAAHGERVDELVVERLVGGSEIAGELLRRDQGFSATGRLGEAEAGRVDAQAVFGGVADEGLGVDRAGEMDVQVGALGKIAEKSAQRLGALVQVGLVDEGGARFGPRGYALGVWFWSADLARPAAGEE